MHRRRPEVRSRLGLDPFTGAPTEYEMYDLARDPLEMTNLAHAAHRTPASDVERARLHHRLSDVMRANGIPVVSNLTGKPERQFDAAYWRGRNDEVNRPIAIAAGESRDDAINRRENETLNYRDAAVRSTAWLAWKWRSPEAKPE